MCPKGLAQDGTLGIDVVLHAVHELLGYDYPASPLRTANNIDNEIVFCLAHGAESCVGVSEAAESPY